MNENSLHSVHRDDTASKLGMWLFIFTELLFFGGLFIAYSVFRYNHATAFALAHEELDVTVGALNTAILLISSCTIAMAITAIQLKRQRHSFWLLALTMALALAFLVNKYFEWGHKIHAGIYPGSEHLLSFGPGETLFFGLYFFMTGLHALHIIIGMVFIGFMMVSVWRHQTTHDNFARLENCGLYWHLVDLIWIFLFPLFYLIS